MLKKIYFEKIFVLTAIAVLLGVPIFSCSANSTLVFSDDFESGSLANWTSPIGAPTISTGPVHSGSYAANFSYATASCYEIKEITPTNTLNYTYYVYFNALPANFLCVVLAGDTYGNELFYRVQNTNGVNTWQFYAGDNGVINSSQPYVTTGQWYKIQFLALTGSNSTLYFLVNDELRATITNQTLGPISELRLGNDWIDFGAYMPQGETYFDDVVATNTITAFVSAFAGEGGSITPSGAVSVDFDGNQTFNITPNANYHIADVKVDGVSVGPVSQYTFYHVQTVRSIQAIFAINTYPLTASAGLNGVISPSGTQSVDFGANKTFNITPNTSYHIADVLVDGSSVGPVTQYTFVNVQSAHTIQASFAINTFTISASAGVNGQISPNGNSIVDYGSSKTFTITPYNGCHIADVKVNGASVGAVGSYTFSNVQADGSITATFALDTTTTTSTTTTTTTPPTPTPSVPTPTPTTTPSAPTTSPAIHSENSNPDYVLVTIIVIIIGAVAATLLVFRNKFIRNPT